MAMPPMPPKKGPMSMDQAFGAAKAGMPPLPGDPGDTGPEMVTCPNCGTTFDANMAKGPGAGGAPPMPPLPGGGPA